MSCCYRSSNCSGVTVFTIWSSLFFLACRQVVKSQLRHDYTASSSPFPRFRKFDAFPFPLQFRNSARNSGIPRFTIGPEMLLSAYIHNSPGPKRQWRPASMNTMSPILPERRNLSRSQVTIGLVMFHGKSFNWSWLVTTATQKVFLRPAFSPIPA